MFSFSVISFLKIFVYVVIALALVISLKEPYQRLHSHELKTVIDKVEAESLINEGLEPYPSLTICRLPSLKVNGKPLLNMQYTNSEQFLEEVKNSYYYNFEEFFDDIGIGTMEDLFDSNISFSLKELSETERSEIMERVLSDAVIFGYCFSLSPYKLYRKMMTLLSNETIERTNLRRMFDLVITMVSLDDHTRYNIYPHDTEEGEIMSGLLNMEDEATKSLQIVSGQSGVFSVFTEYHEKIFNCSSSSNQTLTQCVRDFQARTFRDCAKLESIGKNPGCDPIQYNGSSEFLTTSKLAGLATIQQRTGCSLPCKRFRHFLRESFIIDTKQVKWLQGNSEHRKTIVIIRFQVNDYQIQRHREQFAHGKSGFISELGGQVGLFLGLSIWGMLNSLLTLFKWIEEKCCKGKRNNRRKLFLN